MQVLFVEDDPMNRRVVKDMLTIVGIDMAEAEDAETGLRMVTESHYDVVLMDLRMPGMDGLAAIRSIRARTDAKANTPIIVITADTAINLRETSLESGANQVLWKPVSMNALFDALGEVIDNSGHLII
jgi:CheY-like chemotaxis protein